MTEETISVIDEYAAGRISVEECVGKLRKMRPVDRNEYRKWGIIVQKKFRELNKDQLDKMLFLLKPNDVKEFDIGEVDIGGFWGV